MFDLQAKYSGEVENSGKIFIKKSERMDQLKSNLINCPLILSGMSHEMRTHMNAIVAFSFLMKENCINAENNEEYSSQIFSACEQLMGLFDSFLDTAIMNIGIPDCDARIFRTENILDDLLTEFRDTIKKQHLTELELITENCCSESLKILVDRNKIYKILRILFSNSIKTTSSGYIKIGYQYSDEKLTFYILDSGQGYFKCKEFLHTEDMNESLSVHNDVPTAINITLAKKLIQILGGTIWIESNGLTGTGIYFSIPVKEVTIPDIPRNKYINSMISI